MTGLDQVRRTASIASTKAMMTRRGFGEYMTVRIRKRKD